jgi:hypothetical protein
VTDARRPLIAFVGPSISRAEADRLCPGLDLRPPIRRNELYREREHGAWGFLIVDGVFMHDDAVSPREVADVLEDGALVIGAASMGALRAAECWPAGARGVGLIYRLYRMGVLESDEDVAVAVSGDGTDIPTSLPLVNVRYAVGRAVRRHLLDRARAREIVAAAASIYFPERTWREVERRAGPLPPEVVDHCARLDLKRLDAERALAYACRLLGDAPALAARHGRRRDGPFARSEATRERLYDATGGVDRDRLPGLLLEWLIGSGRLARSAAQLEFPGAVGVADVDALATSTWKRLDDAHQLDGELMRLHAVERATHAADEAGLTPRGRDVRRAREEIALNHGFASWDELLASPRGQRYFVQIHQALERLARAKRMREVWFDRAAVAGGRDGQRSAPPWRRLLGRLGRPIF